MKKQSLIFSCDWGTSNFRIQLADVESEKILSTQTSDDGIAKVHAEWKNVKRQKDDRTGFYYTIVDEHVKKIEQDLNIDLSDVPVLISGMASASIGMMELPYSHVPFSINGSDVTLEKVARAGNISRNVFIISGVRTPDDVMRGEETQLIGCCNDLASLLNGYFIFPGTHSKHVVVKNGKAISIKTFMTGEFFDLLSQKSVLTSSVKISRLKPEFFKKGVQESVKENILHTSFIVRTNQIFGRFSQQENYHFLSGLLIGYEMKDLANHDLPVLIVANRNLHHLYKEALQQINPSISVNTISANIALLRGQIKIWKQSS